MSHTGWLINAIWAVVSHLLSHRSRTEDCVYRSFNKIIIEGNVPPALFLQILLIGLHAEVYAASDIVYQRPVTFSYIVSKRGRNYNATQRPIVALPYLVTLKLNRMKTNLISLFQPLQNALQTSCMRNL